METLIADKIRILSQDLQHLPMNSDRAQSLLNLIQKEKETTTIAPPPNDDKGLQHLEVSLKRFYMNKEFKFTISLLKNYLDRGELECADETFNDFRYRQIRDLVANIVG